MYKFEEIVTGTASHKEIIDQLGKFIRKGYQVEYEEYVTQPGIGTRHEGLEVRCRGFAAP